MKTGVLIASPFEGHTHWICSVVFLPEGQCIVSGSDDSTIRVWDVKIGAIVAGPFTGHHMYVYSVVFSPNGRCVASGSFDRSV